VYPGTRSPPRHDSGPLGDRPARVGPLGWGSWRSWQAQRPSSGQRQPSGIGDPHPDNLDAARRSLPWRGATAQPRSVVAALGYWGKAGPNNHHHGAEQLGCTRVGAQDRPRSRRLGGPPFGAAASKRNARRIGRFLTHGISTPGGGRRRAEPERWESLSRWLSLAGPGDLGLAVAVVTVVLAAELTWIARA
jgi:hypothetical protein